MLLSALGAAGEDQGTLNWIAQQGGLGAILAVVLFVAFITSRWLLQAQKVGQVAYDHAESSMARELERVTKAKEAVEDQLATSRQNEAAAIDRQHAMARELAAEKAARKADAEECRRAKAALARRIRPEQED